MLPAARKYGQITQNSPNFKPRGRDKFGPNFGPNSLFSQKLAENSPNFQSSVLISIISTLGWPNMSNWVIVYIKNHEQISSIINITCYMELGWANITLKMFFRPKKSKGYRPNLLSFGRIFWSFGPYTVKRTWQHCKYVL